MQRTTCQSQHWPVHPERTCVHCWRHKAIKTNQCSKFVVLHVGSMLTRKEFPLDSNSLWTVTDVKWHSLFFVSVSLFCLFVFAIFPIIFCLSLREIPYDPMDSPIRIVPPVHSLSWLSMCATFVRPPSPPTKKLQTKVLFVPQLLSDLHAGKGRGRRAHWWRHKAICTETKTKSPVLETFVSWQGPPVRN